MAAVEAIVTANNGRIVENTIPKILRANPFPPPNSMAGPDGERWAPVHGIVRHSKRWRPSTGSPRCSRRTARRWTGWASARAICSCLSAATGFLIEPCFYWPDEQWEIHEHFIEPAHFSKAHGVSQKPRSARAGREIAHAAVIEVMGASGRHPFPDRPHLSAEGPQRPRGWAILRGGEGEMSIRKA